MGADTHTVDIRALAAIAPWLTRIESFGSAEGSPESLVFNAVCSERSRLYVCRLYPLEQQARPALHVLDSIHQRGRCGPSALLSHLNYHDWAVL